MRAMYRARATSSPVLSSCRDASVLTVAEHPHPGIRAALQHRGRSVGGRVIHDDDLEVRVRLGADASYRVQHEVGTVVDGHEHADSRFDDGH
jgi:hypothetical protein